ncbi:isopenicillin N synthase family dioxygenase [Segnochrobactraceae bacterium EtOH-i3]
MPSALDAVHVSAAALPVIDVSGLASPDAAVRAGVAEEIGRAARDKGFLYIVGHGIDPALRAAVFARSKDFFDLPEADKLALDKANSKASRGYEALRNQTLEAGSPPDLKEGFYMGRDLPADDPRVLAGRFGAGANQWPEIDGFRPVMEDYYRALVALATRLMRGLALSLGLPEDHFAAYCAEPIAILRLLHYPPQPANPLPGEKGCGAHTDFGGLTILAQDNSGGLQVFDKTSNTWLHAEPVPDAFVVNLGDMIQRWTNGKYRSTLHRVVNMSGGERYSVPFFFSGNPDHVVACLPGCLAPGEEPAFPPITVEGHMKERYATTYK